MAQRATVWKKSNLRILINNAVTSDLFKDYLITQNSNVAIVRKTKDTNNLKANKNRRFLLTSKNLSKNHLRTVIIIIYFIPQFRTHTYITNKI